MSNLANLLKDYPAVEVKNYINYIEKLKTEKDKQGKLKNYWATQKSPEYYADAFKKVYGQGLTIDGETITILSTGISYSYLAYKRKLIQEFPNTKINMDIVYKGDIFESEDNSGKLYYYHKPAKQFNDGLEDAVGAFCAIRNERSEFITKLSKKEIAKHRELAKTKTIWDAWGKEMALKTVIKKACKFFFEDEFSEIQALDNESNYDLSNIPKLKTAMEEELEAAKTRAEVNLIYKKYKSKKIKGWDDYYLSKISEINEKEKEENEEKIKAIKEQIQEFKNINDLRAFYADNNTDGFIQNNKELMDCFIEKKDSIEKNEGDNKEEEQGE